MLVQRRGMWHSMGGSGLEKLSVPTLKVTMIEGNADTGSRNQGTKQGP